MYPQAISHGNVLTFTPPGFSHVLNVKFPDSRLAVCEKCKKNYKTRDMCRVRNSHSGPPWATAYMCMTLDDTCTDPEGKFIDKPLTVRMVQWQPFCVKMPFAVSTPVCSSCKKTNRTRAFCRERHKHRFLPWSTVYVMLSALDSTDPSTVVADPSKPLSAEEEEGKDKDDAKKDNEETEKPSSMPGGKKEAARDQGNVSKENDAAKEGDAEENTEQDGVIDDKFEISDDIQVIPDSRTFLVRVSCSGMSIHWLELTEMSDPAEQQYGFVAPPDAIRHAEASPNPNDQHQAQYYAQAMAGYAQQQQHDAFKSQQQQQQHYLWQQQRYASQNAAQHAWQAHYSQQAQHSGGIESSPAPVTAGEAAAQQQKQNQNVEDHGAASQMWPQMYHAQMYQGDHGQAPDGEEVDDMEPAPVHAMPDGEDLPDSKRPRTEQAYV